MTDKIPTIISPFAIRLPSPAALPTGVVTCEWDIGMYNSDEPNFSLRYAPRVSVLEPKFVYQYIHARSGISLAHLFVIFCLVRL